MTKPVYVVEAAFGVATLTDPGSWTDITPYVRSVSTRRGRNHELGRTQAGVASITLDNLDRRFDPTNASGPYYPNVRPMTHIRIRTTSPSATQVFRGFVEDWGQQWGGPAAAGLGDATIGLQAVDAFSVLARREVRSYPGLVLDSGPAGYWRLGADGQAPDDSGNGHHGQVTRGPSLTWSQVAPIAVGNALTPDFTASPYIAVPYSGDLNPTDSWTWEAWFRTDTLGAGTIRPIMSTTSDETGRGAQLRILDGFLEALVPSNVGSTWTTIRGTTALSTATWYHAALTYDGGYRLYLNGNQDATALFTPWGPPVAAPLLIGTPYVNGTPSWDGRLAHIAVYPAALTEVHIREHLSANLDLALGVTSGVAVGEILDAVGWPAGLRTLDTGISTVNIVESGTALDLMQAVAEDTEHGILVMAGDGDVTFVARDTLEKRLTASAAFGDGGGSEVPYSDLQLAYDDQDLWTEVSASGEAGTQNVADATAVSTYGTRTLSVQTLAATANEVADQANGLLNRYKAPAVRPQTMGLIGDRAVDQQLTRAIGDRVTIARRPPGGGTLTVNALLEGIDHDLGPDGWPSSTFSLAPPEPLGFWILADGTYGVLGSTTRLGW